MRIVSTASCWRRCRLAAISATDQQQLVDTLVEQLTSTLALDRHQEKQQQL